MTGRHGSSGRDDEDARADDPTEHDLDAAERGEAQGDGAERTAELPSASPAFTASSGSRRSLVGGAGRVRGRLSRSTKVTDAARIGVAAGVDQLPYVDDRASRVWVGVIAATFAGVFLYALLLGHGGLLTPIASPSPEPSGSPVASATPSPTASSSTSATPGPSVSPSGSASPAASSSPSTSASGSPSAAASASPSASSSASASPALTASPASSSTASPGSTPTSPSSSAAATAS